MPKTTFMGCIDDFYGVHQRPLWGISTTSMGYINDLYGVYHDFYGLIKTTPMGLNKRLCFICRRFILFLAIKVFFL